jgi:hypothetical protein
MSAPHRSIVLIDRSRDIRLFRVREGARTYWLIITPDGEQSFDMGYPARCRFDRLVAKEGHQK